MIILVIRGFHNDHNHINNRAAAFLKRGNDYLLMKRASNRKIAPDVWSVVVGVSENDKGKCLMVWSVLEDFDAEV